MCPERNSDREVVLEHTLREKLVALDPCLPVQTTYRQAL
jgi:hypothetical protein